MYYNKRLYTAVTQADHIPGPPQGEWTYDDYAAIPDDGQRYEVIDGVLYVMPCLCTQHQETVGLFITHLYICVRFGGLGKVLSIPFDAELSKKTVVQPDLVVIFNEHKERVRDHLIGTPDLVVEITFPDSRSYDREQKYNIYARAGVREYWMVDLTEQNIEVLVLKDSAYLSTGIFSSEQLVHSPLLPGFSVQAKQFFDYD